MAVCKSCLLQLLSNAMLAIIMWTIVALVVQINLGADVEYYFSIFLAIAIVLKSWSDKQLMDHAGKKAK